MVEIHTFDSHEEMVAFVEERKAHAFAGLAREQQALTSRTGHHGSFSD